MNILAQTSWGRLALLTLPLAAAVFVAVYFVLPAAPAVSPTSPQPQILGQQAVIIRQQPEAIPQVDPPQLVKPLQMSNVKAKSFLVYDVASGATLAQFNEAFPLPIASLTKLMTAYVVYQNSSLSTDVVTISQKDKVEITPVLGLLENDHIKSIDLFNSMLIGSANDAAQTLANYVGQELNLPFVELMNQEAVRLGMKDSHFSNPIGFDSETNYSTAADLQKLVNVVERYRTFALVGRERSYDFISDDGNKYYIKATNKLLGGDPEISAIKTGYTDEAQGAMITQINHLGHKFIIIVLGSSDREGDTLHLKRAILESYAWSETVRP